MKTYLSAAAPASAATNQIATNQIERLSYRLAGGMIPFMRKYSTICP